MTKPRLVTDADQRLKWLDELKSATFRTRALADLMRAIDLDQHELAPETVAQVAMAMLEQLDIVSERADALWEASPQRQEAQGSAISADPKA